MDTRTTGLFIIGLGIAVALVGVLILTGGLSWFGRLPGDIRIERGNTRIYIPLVSMLLVSLALSVLSYIVQRLL